jgi:hypothetical protein
VYFFFVGRLWIVPPNRTSTVASVSAMAMITITTPRGVTIGSGSMMGGDAT